jgi:hypothetical protein
MSDEMKKEADPVPRASNPPELTEADVVDALQRSANDANELGQKLKGVFALTDTSARLRLR